MQTHDDRSHNPIIDSIPRESEEDFMGRLRDRADEAMRAGSSTITAGKEGEQALEKWKANGVHVQRLPEDEQGVLRISIGGGPNLPVALNYCSFRGNRRHCLHLLKKAVAALEELPEFSKFE